MQSSTIYEHLGGLTDPYEYEDDNRKMVISCFLSMLVQFLKPITPEIPNQPYQEGPSRVQDCMPRS
ncbi:Phosphatidate phosphatase PAH1 [Senna tora]|uniref:Phosphatidate phosphatase PAH1 n=1 Tax=Senna tora TaxID=362788 RepID=A0A834TTH7_9FABA|nr:Phosphatidate phosphatase PAH1 [Senna tora]